MNVQPLTNNTLLVMQYDLYLCWQWASGIITQKLVFKKRGKVPPPTETLSQVTRQRTFRM